MSQNSGDEFAQHLAKKVVTDVCGLVGFNAVKSSSGDILADILRSFITNIGANAAAHAELCGRTESNYFDVKEALDEMGINMKELFRFYKAIDTQDDAQQINLSPFEIEIPAFPCRKKSAFGGIKERKKDKDSTATTSADAATPTSAGEISLASVTAEDGSLSAIAVLNAIRNQSAQPPELKPPSFLPPLPEKHTYAATPITESRSKDRQAVQKMKTKQRRQIEASLTHIHQAELAQSRLSGPAPQQQQQRDSGAGTGAGAGSQLTASTASIVNPYLNVAKSPSLPPSNIIPDVVTSPTVVTVTERVTSIDEISNTPAAPIIDDSKLPLGLKQSMAPTSSNAAMIMMRMDDVLPVSTSLAATSATASDSLLSDASPYSPPRALTTEQQEQLQQQQQQQQDVSMADDSATSSSTSGRNRKESQQERERKRKRVEDILSSTQPMESIGGSASQQRKL